MPKLQNMNPNPLLLLFLAIFTPQAYGNAEDVLVLANSRVKESLELAAYYANARGIPDRNLLRLPMPMDEEIGWEEFATSILTPLREQLLEKGVIEGRLHPEKDPFGRKKYTALFNSAKYLVLCRGTPLRVSNEIEKISEGEREKTQKVYRTTMASVDAELALLPSPNQSPLAFVRNPLFGRSRVDPLTQESLLMVARLDGPYHMSCLRLVDTALAGEQGVFGRAYIDAGGPHKQGNDWMATMATQLEQIGFPYSKDDKKALFNCGDRFDAPALYFGWHAWHAEGPFSRKDFKVPSGALHFHLHSFSAQTLRSDRQNWVGPIIANGAAGTIGNVSEPYLHLTHNLHLLQDWILSGKTLGEAAYYALPALSWQAILVGDPLYRPKFNPPPRIPIEKSPALAPFHQTQYGALAKYLSLKQEGRQAEARDYATAYLKKAYGLALAMELSADVAKLPGSQGLAIQMLEPMANYEPASFQEVPPMLMAAKQLHTLGREDVAKIIVGHLEKSPHRPAEIDWQELRF